MPLRWQRCCKWNSALSENTPSVALIFPELVSQCVHLIQERKRLHAMVKQHNAACSSVVEGSAQDKACENEQQTLSKKVTTHIKKFNSFNAQVGFYIQEFKQPPFLPHDPSRVIYSYPIGNKQSLLGALSQTINY